MTYQILLDGKSLYYPGDEEYVIYNPEINLKMNQAGTAKMTVPAINPLYDSIENRKSMLTVKKNNIEVFYGEVRIHTSDFNRAKEITAAGALSFLNDSIQPQEDYGRITIYTFLNKVLAIHNQQMLGDNRKIIRIGNVSVANDPDMLPDMVTDRESTLEAIRKNLIDVYGGVLKIRHTSGKLYLDYIPLSAYGELCDQTIAIGDNIMDIIEDYNAEDLKTVVIPLGARIDDNNDSDFENRVDITDVNDGVDYLVNQNAADTYGAIWTVQVFDEITDPSKLKAAGRDYLNRAQFERATFKITAVDLSAVDADMSPFYFGDRVKIQSYVVNGAYYIIEMTMKPLSPESERIILSGDIRRKKTTLTGAISSAGAAMKNTAYREALKIKNVIDGEVANIMASFTGASGGYKVEEFDEDGKWKRTLYMDANNVDDAVNIMEISMRGIRFSTGGYAAENSSAWKLAITIDGKIASKEIFSNIVFAQLLKAGIIEDVVGKTSWNLETGKWKSGTNEYREYLQIYEGVLKGIYNNSDIGYIDLSAYTNMFDGSTGHAAVIGSNNELNIEFVNQINFCDKRQNNKIVAYIDGNGYHGQVGSY